MHLCVRTGADVSFQGKEGYLARRTCGTDLALYEKFNTPLQIWYPLGLFLERFWSGGWPPLEVDNTSGCFAICWSLVMCCYWELRVVCVCVIRDNGTIGMLG